ncbi:putative circularly permuted ATP-grasp superfamily protein/putative alpha-E superfamily protein [Phyllobacterium sp. 1468]|uniref:circularly permuted type 2 ATP-grasp protein n=1 Tax=Phyllobacterium sp. 1468 TaxID=2817759 RepID=UPI00285AC1A4|nr:circularly permuted type 2 ATP-grasp protein [Phyllobacterium sp. 1468]MDR6633671.1 putative circularly permuted ATP-grasp superfamily protein/putative alpha-E superfamily protein [Phyllobacterium sp. 1468]
MSKVSQAPSLARSGLLASYKPLPGVADEMIDPSGAVRPGWETLLHTLDQIGPEKLATRFARANQYLLDAGVFYRVYDENGTQEREWPLAHIPILINEADWQTITAGLTQRADLLEEIVADIYGETKLIRDGVLPPDLIASNPEFLHPLAGVKPASGHFLHFCAFELGRAPDGRWWVLGDRTQAASGAGFALENRVATTRALSDISGAMNVYRLAGFFKDFRDSLQSLVTDPQGRAAILTPGPNNETYFEHAYIARYLGFMLLEGDDLTVSNGRVMVRTVSGLKPVDVLWRRMDAAYMDPLELKTDSWIGTPGIVGALRQQSVSLVNALGSGILETRALLAFLPAISKALHNRDLALPSIATWWCGQEKERKHVINRLDQMMVGPALSTRLPFEDVDATVLGSSLDADARAALLGRLEKDGRGLVGQEKVKLSTTPVYVNGKLEPRPFVLRVFAARHKDGWSFMPGGFARVGRTMDTAAIAMQRGGQAADVWITSSGSVPKDTLLPREDDTFRRNVPGTLPSRAAENLMWMGRYIERAEGTARILRACHARYAEAANMEIPLLVEMRAYLKPLGVNLDTAIPKGLQRSIDGAMLSAGRVRDRFSPDGWLALRDLSKTIHRFNDAVSPGDDATRAMTIILRKLAGFSGLVHENMYRFTGWRFLEIGRRLERGIQMTRILATLSRDDAAEGALEMLLEIGDSVMTHRRQYSVYSGRLSVLDLLGLDPLNPRSIIFQLDALKTEFGLLPARDADTHMPQFSKEVLRLHTELAIMEASDLTPEKLETIEFELGNLSNMISDTYFA